ncbi:MAG: hypothetical protein ACLRTX_07150 [Christensenellales bacterium]
MAVVARADVRLCVKDAHAKTISIMLPTLPARLCIAQAAGWMAYPAFAAPGAILGNIAGAADRQDKVNRAG